MDIGSILLILALLILVGLFISRPFFEREDTIIGAEVSEEEHELSALMAERDRILNALQELDFDNALGKIPEQDYPFQRSALLASGAEVLRHLDAFRAGSAPAEDAEARIEAVVAARRADARRVAAGNGRPDASVAVGPDDEMEQLLASRRRQRGEKAAGFCPRCGGAVQKSDRFCPKCGASL